MPTDANESATSSNESATLLELLAQLTYEQLKFLSMRPNYTSDAETARAMGIDKTTIARWPDRVKKAQRAMVTDGVMVAREILRRNVPKAAEIKAAGLDSRHERIRQDAATEILDRHLGKARQSVDVSGTLDVEWDIKPASS